MTTRAPGLTAAMRSTLTDRTGCPFSNGGRMKRALQLRGLIDANGNRREARIQAALAAPRMTAAELAMLEHIAKHRTVPYRAAQRVLSKLRERGWVPFRSSRFDELPLYPAGLTALNNMRAAMGSAEYKETP